MAKKKGSKSGFDFSVPREGNPFDSLRYLTQARDFIAYQKPPPNYIQVPHSDDTRPVGGDAKRPALLDASYAYGRRRLLSVSVPSFIPQDRAFEFKKASRFFGRNKMCQCPGFSLSHIAESLRCVLQAWSGVELDIGCSKKGKDGVADTFYVEFDASGLEDFMRGRELIQKIVHGDHTSDAILRSEMAGRFSNRLETDPQSAIKCRTSGVKDRLLSAWSRRFKAGPRP